MKTHSFATVIGFAILGGLAGGGCVWTWHGDWSESGNPFAWNSAAQSDFWAFALTGAVGGAIAGLIVAIWREKNA